MYKRQVSTISAISLAVGYPTLPSVGHSLINNYKNLLAVAIGSGYHFAEIEDLVDRIENPEKYASAAPAAGAAAASSDAAATEEAAAEDEESEDDDMGFGLFD